MASNLIASFGDPRTITRRRVTTPAELDHGILDESSEATVDLDIIVSIQPPGHSELIRLPEGDRTLSVVVIFSSDEIKTVDQDTGARADLVIIDGVEYEVRVVSDWTGTDLPHYESIAVRTK